MIQVFVSVFFKASSNIGQEGPLKRSLEDMQKGDPHHHFGKYFGKEYFIILITTQYRRNICDFYKNVLRNPDVDTMAKKC